MSPYASTRHYLIRNEMKIKRKLFIENLKNTHQNYQKLIDSVIATPVSRQYIHKGTLYIIYIRYRYILITYLK